MSSFLWVTSGAAVCSLAVAGCDLGEGESVGGEESAQAESGAKSGLTAINPDKELFITDLRVVNDASTTSYKAGKFNTEREGGFSFGRLIDNMSSVEKPSDAQRSAFVLNWLRQWETPQTVIGQVIPARPLVRSVLITPWKLASIGKLGNNAAKCNASPASDFTCKLSFDAAVVPFRLLAIVNRPDLRRVPSSDNAQDGHAGQGRFVFGVLDAQRNPLPATVIFEYLVPVSGRSDIKARAEKWHELGGISFGKKYRDKLHDVSLSFTKWNLAPWRANGSALSQIRTNEVSFAEPGSDPSSPFGLMWEMREFVIGDDGQIEHDTMKQEPPIDLSGTAELAAWVEANQVTLASSSHEVPATFNGQPFLAASSLVPFDFVWSVPGASEVSRKALALSTCNGCHRAETDTFFLHVGPRPADAATTLSPFLTAELAPTGPRVADFDFVLTTDWSNIDDGPGLDHGGKKKRGKGRN